MSPVKWGQFRLDNSSQQSEDQQRFLKFPLHHAKANGLVPLADLRGVIQVVLSEILPVPQVAEFLLGIWNWRQEAVWILDLGCLLGATHWYRQESVRNSGMAILVPVKNHMVGLLVEQVSTIETYNPEQLLPISPSMLPEQWRSFWLGYFLDSQGNALMLLNTNTVIQALQG
jgi:chemotaxis signal transduction protein